MLRFIGKKTHSTLVARMTKAFGVAKAREPWQSARHRPCIRAIPKSSLFHAPLRLTI